MARPRRSSPLDEFTATDLGIGGAMSHDHIIQLSKRGLVPGFGKVGQGAHRIGHYRTLQHITIIGAFRAAGVDLLLAGKIAVPIADHLEHAYYTVPTMLDRYLEKDVNPRYPDLPWDPRENETVVNPDYRQDFWLHHLLISRTGIYRRGMPIIGDFLIEIADRQYVYMDTWSRADQTKVVRDIHYSAAPMFEVIGWERGGEAEVVPSYYEASTLEGKEGRAENIRIEAKYMNAYVGAVGRVRVNISLAIRNALDAIHDRRVEQGLITPKIERRDDCTVP
jgi:hypothetical protein